MKKFCSFFVILAGIFWGSQGIFVKELGKMALSSMDIAAIRVAGTGAVIFLVLLLTKGAVEDKIKGYLGFYRQWAFKYHML